MPICIVVLHEVVYNSPKIVPQIYNYTVETENQTFSRLYLKEYSF
jgi:hypothetical protein